MKAIQWAAMAALVLLAAGCDATEKLLGTNPPGGRPVLMTGVLVTQEGGGYKIQYSFQDKDLKYTDAKGSLIVRFINPEDPIEFYYLNTHRVKEDDFKKYQTIFGREAWAHVLIIKNSDVREAGSGRLVTVKLHFETSGGDVFEDEYGVFL